MIVANRLSANASCIEIMSGVCTVTFCPESRGIVIVRSGIRMPPIAWTRCAGPNKPVRVVIR